MSSTVTLPLWLLVLILLFGGVTFASHFLFPSVRWFLRRRAEKLVERLNTRLDRKIEPFKLARRRDRIVRLVYDPAVLQAVTDHAAETGIPPSVAFEEAQTYAREIVPGFSATFYFSVATRLARWLSRLLYRVRIGAVDQALDGIDPDATVIFVMNHRSNMDYVLVTWLVATRSALSYAVGEWARIWPLGPLIRASGAYFIRRNSRNALYRRVLARYVQMATAEGITQAVFPEGGLSLDGRVGPAKMGLLHYIVSGFTPEGRDVVFVPVGLAYDRVLEDRVLVAAAAAGTRRFRTDLRRTLALAAKTLWGKLRGTFNGFGTAAAGFGAPLSLRDWQAEHVRPVEALGAELMARIQAAVPVVPVPLVAAILRDGPATRAELHDRSAALAQALQEAGAHMRLAAAGRSADEGLQPLLDRGIVVETAAGLQIAPDKAGLAAFYAASVQQWRESSGNAATRRT